MSDVVATILAALVAGVLGYLTPLVVRRLPEPGPDSRVAELEALALERELSSRERLRLEEPPKPLYADVAALPWLAPTALAVSGVAGGLVGASVGWSWLLVGLVPLVPVLAALSLVDLRTKLLPAVVVLPTLWTLVVLVVLHAALVATWSDLERGVAAMVVAYVFYWILWIAVPLGIGYGDVRLAPALGLVLGYLGWGHFLVGMYSGFLLLGLPGLVIAIARRRLSYLKTQIPFGPFMVTGALIGLVVGQALTVGLAVG